MSYPNLNRTSSGTRSGTSIVRRLSDKVMQSSSARRLEHYSAQRAQDARDALPLIQSEKRFSDQQQQQHHRRSNRSSNYLPSSPTPSYQPPHQLIAVCFNHMAGRDCEHCRNLDHSLSDRRSDSSPHSDHTLGYNSQHSERQRHSKVSLYDEKHNDGGEKGGEQGPPPVVGFWDSRLGKLRLQLLGLWGRTSKRAFTTRPKTLL